MNELQKPVVFSGIQPTGKLHIGNYIGALSVWVEGQDKYDNVFCVVDLHAMTIPDAITPEYIRQKTREVAALYISAGIDPSKSTIFIQSRISAHAELAWILNCITPIGWLERMTQYKSKAKRAESVGTGLLDYPVLQASDILLYKTNLVPVGEDQRQHIELTRDIAQKFNRLYGNTFVVPEAFIRSSGARIMGLDDPTIKMSKSLGERIEGHSIGLLDSHEIVRKTIMQATTDSGNITRFEDSSDGVLNLLTIYQTLTKQSQQEVEEHFSGRGYGLLKRELIDVVIAVLKPIQARYAEISADPSYLEDVLQQGMERVAPIAQGTLAQVKGLLGLG